MKKIIALLLACCLTLSVFIVSVSAEVKLPEELRYKYTENLENKLLSLDEDDPIDLVLWLSYDTPDDYGVDQADYSDPEKYRLAKIQAAKAFHTEINARYLSEIAQYAEFEVVYDSMFTPMILISAKASEVEKLIPLEQISFVDWNYTGSEPLPSPTESEGLFKARFDAEYNPRLIASYEELYYHRDAQGAIDWALIKTELDYNFMGGTPVELAAVVGNRVLIKGAWEYPFGSGYGIYDVKEDKFVNMVSSLPYYTAADYEGLGEAFDEIGQGRLLGDIDRDDELTIVDATLMQRCDVRMRDWPQDDRIPFGFSDYPKLRYYSDFNRDGERDIIDATVMQRYVTGIGR